MSETPSTGCRQQLCKRRMEQQASPRTRQCILSVQAFLQAWVPEPETLEADAETPPELGGDEEELSSGGGGRGPRVRPRSIHTPESCEPLRGAELATLAATKSTRGVLVPCVAAALGEVWQGHVDYEPGTLVEAVERLEDALKEKASPGVARLRTPALRVTAGAGGFSPR